jgi:putative ABC transport system permease protein
MLKHYLTILRRTVARQPVHTLLNLSCLAVSIAAALLTLLYLDFELTYDRFHARADQIYRIDTRAIKTREKVIDVQWNATPAPLGPLLKQDYPEVAHFVRFYKFWAADQVAFGYGIEVFGEEAVFAVDSTVFNVFSFGLVRGNPQNALHGPNKIILSESMARRVFNGQDPVGKILTAHWPPKPGGGNGTYALLVTGVYADPPKNSHLIAEALISSATDPQLTEYYFNTFNVSTYVLLHEEVDPDAFAPKVSRLYEKYLDAAREPVMVSASHALIPLTDIHLEETGGLTYVYTFGAVGLLLLLIATISYVNLTTAQAGRRATEIGLRKVMGSDRRQLVVQFLVESSLLTLLALGLGTLLVVWVVKPLNQLLSLQLDAQQLWQPQLLLGMLLVVVALGILGGSYPAFFLSAIQPVSVMKGKSLTGAPLRQVLVSIQLGVVIFVLCCTAMIYEQLQYVRRKDLGFDKEHIVRLTLSGGEELRNRTVFKDAILQSAYVAAAGTSDFVPGTDDMVKGPVAADGAAGQEAKFVRRGKIDYHFFATLGIRLVAGRNFSPDFPGDSARAVIVNEALVRAFGLKKPIGEKIRFGDKGNPHFFQVIGVVEDFHQSSLHRPIEPQLFILRPADQLVVKIGRDIPAAMNHLEKTWAQLFPRTPFAYRFLDDQLQDGYKADQVRGRIFLSFSLLTVFIAFLGLFGLASYLATQRVREVGIRKVLGANVWDVVLLLTKDFVRLVVIAAVPAFVAAWYLVSQWLESFASRAATNLLPLGLILLGNLLLTFLTTGWHALRAARLNPVETLK